MSNTKIKSSQFHGVVGHGTDGYFLITNGDGSMSWIANIVNPVISSLSYPGSATAADPAGGETITITGTGFKTGATVTVGGTAAPSVSYVSATSLTITTPAKAAGDYDVVVTNTDGGTATSVNGISFNGIPSWTTAAGTLGTFASDTTISTITLQASEPDSGTITFSITNGALPTGLSLTGADIDGTTTLETADTLYTFTVTATDDETQTTPRTFTITVTKQFINTENFTINTYTGNGSTQSIEGKIGTAASFNGSNSYIDLGSASSLVSTNFTFSAWVKTTSTSTNFIVGTNVNPYYSKVAVRSEGDGRVRCLYGNYTSNENWFYSNFNTINNGGWHHIVYFINQTTAKLYIDGSLDTTHTLTITPTTNGDLTLATYYSDNNNSYGSSTWDGTLDQVRIFNKELSLSEVTTLYGESNTSTTKSTTDIFDDGSGIALSEFEEGAKDTGGVSGYIGSGGIFNGSSSIIKNTSLGTDYRGQTTLSLSAWFKTSASSGRMTIVSFSATGDGSTDLFLGLDANTVGFRNISDGISQVQAENISGTSVRDGDWHHVVFTADSSGNKLYVDGSQITVNYDTGASSTTIVMPSDLNQFNIGGNQDSSGNQWYWDGKLDQVRIFDKALSSSEVTTLYQETSASSTKSTTDIFSDSSGVALYELEGNANDTGPDGSFSNHGFVKSLLNGDYFDTNVDQVQTQTISFWAKIPTTTGAYRLLSTTTNSSGDIGYIFRTSGNNNELQFVDIQGGATNNSATWASTESGQWKHFVIVLDSTEARIYENNVLKATVAAANTTLQNGGNIRFGAGIYYGSDAYLEYKHIRTYLRALNTTEINTLYNENFTNLNVISSPQSWFNFDNNSSGSVNDKTGSYTGNISGMTYTAPSNYDGTATNVSYAYDGTPANVSFVGTSFQPDLVWFKDRGGAYSHALYNSINGRDKFLRSNNTDSLRTGASATQDLVSFDTNGFTLGTDYHTVNNANGRNYVAWCWKAASSDSTNTDGTITSTVRANQDAGFSIVKYTGNGSTGATVGHGMSSTPQMMISKRTDTGDNWNVYTEPTGNTGILYLNLSDAFTTVSNRFNNTSPTSEVFTLGNSAAINANGGEYIAYCFHSVDGYQKVGSYTGTGATGNVVNVGFKPRFLLWKKTNGAVGWFILDGTRNTSDVWSARLEAHNSNAEAGPDAYTVTVSNTGFEMTGSFSNWTGSNELNSTYIYLAIA